jgi:alkylation response protein AidB-like acyl-CoA dehydrogenase
MACQDSDINYSDIDDELRSVARDLLAKNPEPDVRLLAQAGWLGLEAPEDVGGAGATFREVAIVAEEMGRAVAEGGYFGGAVLGVGTLTSVQPNTFRDVLLKDLVSGAVTVAVAVSGDHETIGGSSPFALQETADGLRLDGRSVFVPDGAGAGRLLLLASHPAGQAVIVDVAADATGLAITEQAVVDGTRHFAAVSADDVGVAESSVWRFDGDAGLHVQRLLDRAAVAVACDSLGVAEAMLSATVSFAEVRHQFGRPIGSFQAVKHACADMLVRISVARQLVRTAVDAVAGGRPDVTTAASMAKSYACGAAVEVAGKAMQLHGGIGYTWDSGIHAYLKRAALNRCLFGSPAVHRKKLAQRYFEAKYT